MYGVDGLNGSFELPELPDPAMQVSRVIGDEDKK